MRAVVSGRAQKVLKVDRQTTIGGDEVQLWVGLAWQDMVIDLRAKGAAALFEAVPPASVSRYAERSEDDFLDQDIDFGD